MSEIKNGGLDQYSAEPFKQQQFGTSGVEGVKTQSAYLLVSTSIVRIFLLYSATAHEENETGAM